MRHTVTTAAFFFALALCVAGVWLNMRWLAFAGMALSAAAWWAREGDRKGSSGRLQDHPRRPRAEAAEVSDDLKFLDDLASECERSGDNPFSAGRAHGIRETLKDARAAIARLTHERDAYRDEMLEMADFAASLIAERDLWRAEALAALQTRIERTNFFGDQFQTYRTARQARIDAGLE